MLLNKERILTSSRLCQAVLGTSKVEIEKLLPRFSQCLVAYRWKLKPKRKRRLGGGRKEDLPMDLDKLRCPELKDVFMDGTEHQTQRSRNLKRRKKLYSGKKKSTAGKTIVLSDEKKRILFMITTKSARRHDKRVADKFGLAEAIPQE